MNRPLSFVWVLLLAMSLTGSVSAEDGVTTFTLPEPRSASGNMSGADVPWLDTALGAVGLPGTAGTSDDETTYDRARRMQSGYGGSTRLSYGERYRRNPDGSYGAQSSSQWNRGNVADRLLEQALSAGSGYFSSWAEGWLGGYGNARIQLRINDEGEVTGAGDFLLPLYDSERSTFFTQLGLRTMANDRVIGNFGLGQRFFPADNLAFGYNTFIDQDFSRNHTRGGVGLEAWYDWLRLSGNYYTPLSGWKDSKDYDARLVEERPAEGFDARLTGYLPFYRNLAVTGGYEKWKGDHVGSFGSDDVVQKDPKIWSYGLEWTPVPAFAASVNQRHSGGHDETQFGLTFNYHFGMDWEDQLSPAMVAEMRTVDGSRHEFVNRQNEIILAYQAKEGAYNIVLVGAVAGLVNVFEFRLTNGFGEPAAGQMVRVSASDGVNVLPAGVLTTDANGAVQVELKSPGGAALATTVMLVAGKSSRSFNLNLAAVVGGSLTAAHEQNLVSSTVELTFTLTGVTPLSGQTVTWSIQSGSGTFSSGTSTTNAGGVATVNLTGTVTPGPVTVRGTVPGGYYAETTVRFGILSGALTVVPQTAGGDIVVSDGNTVLKATCGTGTMFDDGSGAVAYTGDLSGLTVNWSKVGDYIYTQTGAATSPPSGALSASTGTMSASPFSGAAINSGVATVTFTPDVASGTGGGVQVQAALAAPHTASGTVNVGVGFDPNWSDNSNPSGWTSAVSTAGGTGDLGNPNYLNYQSSTSLPTFEQLRGVSAVGYRPASLTYPWFWSGVSQGNGDNAGFVNLVNGNAGWDIADYPDVGVLALR